LGESGTVKIVDFGVAKVAAKLGEKEKGVLKGKFAYMSPEQARGEEVDARSDIFSAGVLFWEALTGRRLFKKSINTKTVEAVQQMQIYPPSAYRAEVPAVLDKIVMKALSRDPRERFSQAEELSLALTKFNLEHYPEFKVSKVAEILQDFFEEEDRTGDLAYEKTHFDILEGEEERTFIESDPSKEVTAVVDLQSLELESLFEDIDMDEVSEVTRSIVFEEGVESLDPAQLEAGLAEEFKEELKAEAKEEEKPLSSKFRKFWLIALVLLALILVLLLFFHFR
ncbi:MAG: protein kinase, partial [Deltaproteobacteria bacterium]|nr:protein kinase [Deltaproteobacteria bacterium]